MSNFLFSISNPLHLETEMSLGFDSESSEVKVKFFFPLSDSVTVNTGLREAK